MKPLTYTEKIVVTLRPADKRTIERMAQIYGLPTAVYARMALLGYVDDDKRGLKVPQPEGDDAA